MVSLVLVDYYWFGLFGLIEFSRVFIIQCSLQNYLGNSYEVYLYFTNHTLLDIYPAVYLDLQIFINLCFIILVL